MTQENAARTDEEIIEWLGHNGFYVGTSRHLELAKLCIRQGYTDAAQILHPLSDLPIQSLPDTIKNPSLDYSIGVRRGLVIAENAVIIARDQIK